MLFRRRQELPPAPPDGANPPVESEAVEVTPRRAVGPDRDPFWRTNVDTTIREETIPSEPSANLEREGNYSKNEEINSLIELVREGGWKTDDSERRFNERYGQGRLAEFKAWLDGAYDVLITEDDSAQWQWKTEAKRRLANVALKTGYTAAATAAIGFLIGNPLSLGLISTSLAGAGLARLGVQTWQFVNGRERGLRQRLTIARARGYAKAKELADRIADNPSIQAQEAIQAEQIGTGALSSEELGLPPESNLPSEIPPPSREALEGTITRNQAIKDLVNFVYTSEQNTFTFRYNKKGEPVLATSVEGEPLSTSGLPGVPEPGGPTGPTLNTGTEVYQPSTLAPGETIDDLEKELEAHKRKWKWIEEGAALFGGLAVSVQNMLASKVKIAQELTQKLESGKGVALDIDQDGVRHVIQHVYNQSGNLIRNAQDYVYLFKDHLEALAAQAKGAITGKVAGGQEAHWLWNPAKETVLQLSQDILGAINREAFRQSLQHLAVQVAGLYTVLVGQGISIDADKRRFEASREQLKEDQEITRRRLQPESLISTLKAEAKALYKDFPEAGQKWRRVTDPEAGPGEVIDILSVDDELGRARIRIKDLDGIEDRIKIVPINEVYRNYELIEQEQDEAKIIEKKKKEWAKLAVESYGSEGNSGVIPEIGETWIVKETLKNGNPEEATIKEIRWLDPIPTVIYSIVVNGIRPITQNTKMDEFLTTFVQGQTKEKVPTEKVVKKVEVETETPSESKRVTVVEEVKEPETTNEETEVDTGDTAKPEVEPAKKNLVKIKVLEGGKWIEKEKELKSNQILTGRRQIGEPVYAWQLTIDDLTGKCTLKRIEETLDSTGNYQILERETIIKNTLEELQELFSAQKWWLVNEKLADYQEYKEKKKAKK